MAITYLSGQRIQGSSVGNSGVGKIAGTSGTGSVFADITRYDSENDAVSFDLGSNLSDTQWTLRFKFVIDSITRSSTTSGRSFWGMSSADANTTANSNQDSICFGITYGSDSGEDQFRAYNSNGGAMEDAFANIGSSMLATGTWYVTVDRTTATNQTVSVTTNSDYTTGATSASDSILSTLEDLRYFVVKTKTGSTENNHIYCNVQDVKIWNATNDTSGSPTYTPDMSTTSGWVIKNSSRVNVVPITQDDKTTVTDVPDGSQFEETDTRKFYQMSEILVSGANLKAYWKFDESSGTTAVNDAGNVAGNSGATLGTGAELTLTDVDLAETGSPANLGTNALFDGTDSYAVTPSSTESNFDFFFDGSSWSVSFWYKASAGFTSNQKIIDNHASSDSTYGVDIRTNQYEGEDDHKIRVVLSDGSLMVDFKSTDNYVPDETDFHHYVFTWVGGSTNTATMWRDGGNKAQKVGSAGSSGTSTDDLTVGSASNVLSGDLKGNLLELAIFERVLTDAEILKIYNDGDGLQLDTGLKVWKERGTAI